MGVMKSVTVTSIFVKGHKAPSVPAETSTTASFVTFERAAGQTVSPQGPFRGCDHVTPAWY